MSFSTILLVFAVLLIGAVALPFVRSSHWSVRVFDYPRVQKLFLVVVLIAVWVPVVGAARPLDRAVLFALAACAVYLLVVIRPYTLLGRKMVERATPGVDEKPLSLLVCNVLQTNTAYARLERLIAERQPDVVVLLETDERWRTALQHAVESYPHRVEVPQPDTYGMLFYSRLPLVRSSVEHLVDPEVPSIFADVEYAGEVVRLYCLHPTPPVPQENDSSKDRDVEVLQVGRLAADHKGPCIVLGDLNDVAWSRTTRLFMKTSELLDPRRGRGLYNTFNAHYPFLRWPLDHFFVSGHFRLATMRVEPSIGSDHFPISLSVLLRMEDDSEKLDIDREEEQEVSEKIAEGGE
jgi:endonuclease/exonuclease/phosphatase (EEP) superfamily protein YafD